MLKQSALLDEFRDMLLNSSLLSNLPPAEILSATLYFSQLNLSRVSLDKLILESPRIAVKIIHAIAISLSKRLRMADGKLVGYLG